MRIIPNPEKEKAEEVYDLLKGLLKEQLFAVLATVGQSQPYTSLVGFTASSDISRIYFATSRFTRKFKNLKSNPRVSMLFDNRDNLASDLDHALAVTAVGKAAEADPESERPLFEAFITKQPGLEDFIQKPETALIRFDVKAYYLVSRFETAFEIRP